MRGVRYHKSVILMWKDAVLPAIIIRNVDQAMWLQIIVSNSNLITGPDIKGLRWNKARKSGHESQKVSVEGRKGKAGGTGIFSCSSATGGDQLP